MTPKQDKVYWRLWAAVLRAHPALKALPKDQQSDERHALTLEATKGRTSEHKAVDPRAECTRLFQLLKFKARPLDIGAARAVANPGESAEQDEQRRCVFALSSKGLSTLEIAHIAAPLCRKHRVGNWERLPSKVLKEMLGWKQFHGVKKAAPVMPLAQASAHTEEHQIVYELRPYTTQQPVEAGPF